jgi:hypothetical protein
MVTKVVEWRGGDGSKSVKERQQRLAEKRLAETQGGWHMVGNT